VTNTSSSNGDWGFGSGSSNEMPFPRNPAHRAPEAFEPISDSAREAAGALRSIMNLHTNGIVPEPRPFNGSLASRLNMAYAKYNVARRAEEQYPSGDRSVEERKYLDDSVSSDSDGVYVSPPTLTVQSGDNDSEYQYIDTESSEYESSCAETDVMAPGNEWQGYFYRRNRETKAGSEDSMPEDFVWRKWDFMDEPDNNSGYSS
jgi:hypothetical protein